MTAAEQAAELRRIAGELRERERWRERFRPEGVPGSAWWDAEAEQLERAAATIEALAGALRDLTGYTSDDVECDAAWDRAVELVTAMHGAPA